MEFKKRFTQLLLTLYRELAIKDVFSSNLIINIITVAKALVQTHSNYQNPPAIYYISHHLTD